jgi:hypothetical protein
MSRDASTLYRIKITLREIRPPIWRRIELDGNTSLYKLHRIIQEAFGWSNSHLHQFIVAGEFYGESVPEADFELRSGRRFKVDQAAPEVGDTFLYEYDFGDGWIHEIKVEAIDKPEAGASYPRCTKGKRRGPPEDVGGPWGYEEFLEAIADPEHEEHEEYLDWVGGSFDPEVCELEAINTALKCLK